jgi:hypothetical protein
MKKFSGVFAKFEIPAILGIYGITFLKKNP